MSGGMNFRSGDLQNTRGAVTSNLVALEKYCGGDKIYSRVRVEVFPQTHSLGICSVFVSSGKSAWKFVL